MWLLGGFVFLQELTKHFLYSGNRHFGCLCCEFGMNIRFHDVMGGVVLKAWSILRNCTSMSCCKGKDGCCGAPIVTICCKANHEYHIAMWKGLMNRGTRMAIIKVGCVFRRIYLKVIDPSGAQSLKEDTSIALCLLEKKIHHHFLILWPTC